MNDRPTAQPIPADDPRRQLVVARPEQDDSLPHIALAGNTYTIILSGTDTAGAYCLIDMRVPPGGGPRPIATTSRRCSPSWTGRSR
ncbi:hypothetical protein NCC78_11225 [Micromonospora phytophila]|uniref:hypothetical protein n=1 Tax=Micromonospora phytophila TaxID=709888 RepID=UPI00202E199E|nr:hypothetical protein [Micromonospora phytophila]MCM0675253.1 hypothetical protein [Micromonospora phytophila]